MYDRIRGNEIRKPRKIVSPVFSLIFVLFIGLFSTGLLYPSLVGSADSKKFTLEPKAGEWETWVLESGSQYRPADRCAYDSAELAAEMDEVRALVEQRTGKKATHGFFWEFGAGGVRNSWFWNDHAGRKILETGLGSTRPIPLARWRC